MNQKRQSAGGWEKLSPAGGTRVKIRLAPQSVGVIFWGVGISVQNLNPTIHQIVVNLS